MKLDSKTIVITIIAAFAVYFLFRSPGKANNIAKTSSSNGKKPLYSSSEMGMFSPADPQTLAQASAPIPKEKLLSDYLAWAKYPPNSRPLKESHVDVIDHRRVSLLPQKMPFLDGKDIRESGYSCVLQPESKSITADEVMLVYLRCRADDGNQANAAIDIESYSLEGKAGGADFNPNVPLVGDNGRDGDKESNDRIYTFQYQPDPDDWGDLYLTVKFTIKGDDSGFVHSLNTYFFSSPKAPAHFRGVVSEELKKGSLYIGVELNVKRSGHYKILANLFSGKNPVAYARVKKKLLVGIQKVELEFYGKVLVDSEQPGPYTVSGLRGSVNTSAIQPEDLQKSPEEVAAFLAQVESSDPEKMVIPHYPKSYTTQYYSLKQFTSAEWDSDEKQDRIALIEDLPQ